jgi:NADPH:quinone reductase-like Zn-dependent oxidoreductase
MAIQMARECGASVIVTAGSDERCAFARSLGADLAINYKREDFVEAVHRHTGGAGVDIILDMVGGPNAERNIASLKMGGRLCYVSLQEGMVATFDLLHILLNRLTVTGANLRRRSVEEKGRLGREIEKRIWPLVRAGRVSRSSIAPCRSSRPPRPTVSSKPAKSPGRSSWSQRSSRAAQPRP